jgi:mono/diheme cytochrome c family protein
MRRGAVAWALGLLCACGSMIGCEPRDQTPLGRGRRIFQRTCAGCHGPDGRGVQRLGLVKPPRDLTRAEFHAQVTDEQLRQVIRTGKGQMPAFGGLMGDEDLSLVITYIRSLPPRPPPAAAPATSSAGGAAPSSALSQVLESERPPSR